MVPIQTSPPVYCTDRTVENILVSLVVPVFNESDTVHIFVQRIHALLAGNDKLLLEIVFVNDGSDDNTLQKLIQLQNNHPYLRIIDLSRNFGKEAALSAGLQAAKGQVVVPLDVDLQDPPELILPMLEKWRQGYDVVMGKRISRKADSWAKRKSANLFYQLHNKISEIEIAENAGDFRLMDRIVVDALNQLPESRRFMKGLFAWAGFCTTTIEYDRPERIAGSSKFNGWGLWNFALEGITSFSTAPLRVWTYLGGLVALASIFFAIFLIIKVTVHGADVPGYTSLMVAVSFLGGLQLIGIGVLGEYLGRTYIESKRRPIYLVRRIYEGRKS